MSRDFEKFIQNNRESFDDQTPDPAVLERIQHQMAATKKRGVFISMNVIRWAAACLLIAGAGTFFMLQNNPAENLPGTAKIQDVPLASSPQEEIPEKTAPVPAEQVPAATSPARHVRLETTVPTSKQVMFARLNDSQSAGQRIMGAEQAYNLQNTDKEIVDVLVKTMNSDPNTNVRLAALEALGQFNRVSYVKQQLISSLKIQKDPIVQIGLIQLLTGMKETVILQDLEKLVQDDTVREEVKDQAHSSIFLLKS